MKKLIDSKFIRTLKPCEAGILDFEYKHPNFKGKLSDILSLDDVSYYNKVWLASKIAPIKLLQQWSVECVEFVLPNFEREFPNDSRVRDCINTTKLVIQEKLPESAQSAAWAAQSAAELEQEYINLSFLIALLKNEGLYYV